METNLESETQPRWWILTFVAILLCGVVMLGVKEHRVISYRGQLG
jgi:hypothetical protein